MDWSFAYRFRSQALVLHHVRPRLRAYGPLRLARPQDSRRLDRRQPGRSVLRYPRLGADDVRRAALGIASRAVVVVDRLAHGLAEGAYLARPPQRHRHPLS